MAILNHRFQNKNYAKRTPVAANFKVAMVVPGGLPLVDGEHIVGAIEGDILITKVTTVVSERFNGGAPVATVTDSDGVTYANGRNLSTVGAVGSPVTNPDPTTGPVDPIYKPSKTEFYIDINTDGSTTGEFSVVIEYVQLDTMTGFNMGGRTTYA